MIAQPIKLHYWLSAQEFRQVLEGLALESEMGKDRGLRFALHPVVLLCFAGFMAVHWIHWAVDRLPDLWSKSLGETLVSGEIVSHLFALLTTWLVGELIVNTARHRLSRKAQNGEGVIWGAHRLQATTQALEVSLSDYEVVYRWTAFQECKKMDDMLYLMLSPRDAVAVPERAFKSEPEERAFRDFVEERIAAGTAGPWGARVEDEP